MASSGVAAWGTQFHWNDTHIAELTSISGPSETMDPIDLTSHDSPSTYREFVAGLRDGGEITIEGNFIKGDAAGQIDMHEDFQNGQAQSFELEMPNYDENDPAYTGTGLITAFSLSFPFDDKISFSATIKITGKPTLTPV